MPALWRRLDLSDVTGFSGPQGHKEGIAFMVAKRVERNVSMALRVMGVVCIFTGLAFLVGCRTYLVSGGFPSETESKTVSKRYRIESLKLPDGLISMKEDAGLTADDVRRGIVSYRPDIFDQHVDSLPIAVEVVKLNAKERPAYREFLCRVI